MTPKIEISNEKFAHSGHFKGSRPFWGSKNSFLDFFEVFFELFTKCLGIVFGLRRPTFGYIFDSRLIIEPENRNFGSKIGGFEESYLTIF